MFIFYRAIITTMSLIVVMIIKEQYSIDDAKLMAQIVTYSQLIYVVGFVGCNIEIYKDKNIRAAIIYYLLFAPLLIFALLFNVKYTSNVGMVELFSILISLPLLSFAADVFRVTGKDGLSHVFAGRPSYIITLPFVFFVEFSSYLEVLLIVNLSLLLVASYITYSEISSFSNTQSRLLFKRRFMSFLTSALNYSYQNLDVLIVLNYFESKVAVSYFFITRIAKSFQPVFAASNSYFQKKYASTHASNKIRNDWFSNIKINLALSLISVIGLSILLLINDYFEFYRFDISDEQIFRIFALSLVSFVFQNIVGATGMILAYNDFRLENMLIVLSGLIVQMSLFYFIPDINGLLLGLVISSFYISVFQVIFIFNKVLGAYAINR